MNDTVMTVLSSLTAANAAREGSRMRQHWRRTASRLANGHWAGDLDAKLLLVTHSFFVSINFYVVQRAFFIENNPEYLVSKR